MLFRSFVQASTQIVERRLVVELLWYEGLGEVCENGSAGSHRGRLMAANFQGRIL